MISYKVGKSDRFEDTGNIDCAISHHQRAMELTPSGDPSYLNNLGQSYLGRFKQSGDLQDVDHAISHGQRAVEYTLAGHANLPLLKLNLSRSNSSGLERPNLVRPELERA